MVPALEEALKQLKSENYKKADVLMISDFIIDKINSNIESQIEQTKQNGQNFIVWSYLLMEIRMLLKSLITTGFIRVKGLMKHLNQF